MRTFVTSCIASVLLAGCAEVADSPPDESSFDQEVQAANGTSLNGTSLNGTSLNGTTLAGTSLQSVALAGGTLGGTPLTMVSVLNSTITGKKGAASVTGTALVGATLIATATNTSTFNVRIDGVHLLAAPNADTTAYVVSYQTSSGWSPLCPNTGNEAIALTGTWNLTTGAHQADANRFVFACRDATFAKCVELGYKPWKTVASVNLENHHQACTRALRADYCGDGSSYTVNGTTIDIFDGLGIQADTQAWKVESTWTASGAACLEVPRILTSKAKGAVPDCVYNRGITACTAGFSGGTLIRTEVNK